VSAIRLPAKLMDDVNYVIHEQKGGKDLTLAISSLSLGGILYMPGTKKDRI